VGGGGNSNILLTMVHRTGANTANGYILTYLHQIDWEEGKREAERINSNKS
jgi:hypothetical protein